MIDETATQSSAAGPAASGEGSAEPVVAFCQQCGRALTASTRRQVGSGIFCEPCATAQQAAGWNPVKGSASPYAAGTSPAAGEPNPALAGFLGLIPGVGAMYNGQYAKGVIHLIVFVVLVSLADNLNWVFWWFVWGWIFYQAFEAYHTALARRDGLPIPDPFGWNELGERLGFTRSTPPNPPRAGRPAPPPPFTPAPSAEQPSETAGFNYQPTVPYTAPPPPVSPVFSGPAGTPYGHVPYNPTFTGPSAGPAMGPVMPPLVQPPVQRFPAGAVWLIALGVLFLLGNMLPAWRITGRWLVPILLAGIALWIGGRRLTVLQATPGSPLPGVRPSIAGALLGPCILLTVAILIAMQNAYWISLKHSWPAILIVWGALLLLDRSQRPAPPPFFGAGEAPPAGDTVPPPPR